MDEKGFLQSAARLRTPVALSAVSARLLDRVALGSSLAIVKKNKMRRLSGANSFEFGEFKG